MFRSLKWATPVLALGMLISFTAVRAIAEDKAEKKDTGTVSGTVTGTDGKPAAKVLVRLFHPMEHHGKDAAKSSNSDKSETKAAGDEKPAKGDKPIPVANATTGDDGKFSMKDVPVGKYEILAQVKGVGRAHDVIEVKSGEDTAVDLKLEHKECGGKSASGGDKTEKPAKSE
jgi:hypothetical protein